MVGRLGIRRSWAICMLALAIAGAGLAATAAVPVLAIVCGAVFGAAYIALTGVLLVWATRLHPGRAATGVGLVFLALAVGQGVGAPLVGWLSESVPLATVFIACAALTAIGGALGPRSGVDRTISEP
jgi:predicted MFS family arabinose efflux permease